MSNRTMWAMLTGVLAGIIILFALNYLTHLDQRTEPLEKDALSNELKFDPAKIRGMAIEKEGKTYTLNLDQQNQALRFLDRAQPVDKADYPTKSTSIPFSRLTLYRYGAPDIVLVPFTLKNEDIVWEVASSNFNSYFLEESGGEMYNLLIKAGEP